MDVRELLHKTTPAEREAIAKRARTTVAYLYQIAGGHKRPGVALVDRLCLADPRLSKRHLRPDWFAAPTPSRRSSR